MDNASVEQDQMRFPVTVGERGRIVLPAKLREVCDLQAGDRIMASVEADGSIKLEDRRAVLKRLRGFLRRPEDAGRSIVDEYLTERKEEAAKE